MPSGNIQCCESTTFLTCLTEGKFSLKEIQIGHMVPGKYFDSRSSYRAARGSVILCYSVVPELYFVFTDPLYATT